MSTWKLEEKSTGLLTVEVENNKWVEAQEKAFKKISENFEKDGFRKGHVPTSIVKKEVSEQAIAVEAIDFAAQEALEAGVNEHNLELVARPEIVNIDGVSKDACTLVFKVTVKPEVTLGAYKGLPLEVAEVEVTEEDVNAELEKMRERYAENESKDVIESGDNVKFDFEGFKDGVAFEGGKADDYELVIGSNQFIPGFEDAMIGLKKDEEKDIDLTFPEDYQAADLAGAAVVFHVKVKEITSKVLPEVSDDLAQDMNIAGVETAEALVAHVREDLLKAKKEADENEAFEKTLEVAINNATVDLPDALVESELDEMVRNYGQRFQQQGMQLDQFLQMTGQTMEDLRGQMKEDATKSAKLRLVLEKIVEVEEIDVTEEDLNAEYEKMSAQYGMEVDKIKEIVPAQNLKYDVKMQKALNLIKG